MLNYVELEDFDRVTYRVNLTPKVTYLPNGVSIRMWRYHLKSNPVHSASANDGAMKTTFGEFNFEELLRRV